MLLTERLQFEPEVLASVWASDDRRPGYLLKSPALDSISAIVAGWMGGGEGVLYGHDDDDGDVEASYN
jgi:hypothetical protein